MYTQRVVGVVVTCLPEEGGTCIPRGVGGAVTCIPRERKVGLEALTIPRERRRDQV